MLVPYSSPAIAYLALPSLRLTIPEGFLGARAVLTSCGPRRVSVSCSSRRPLLERARSRLFSVDMASSTATPLPKMPVTVPFYRERPYPQVLVEVFLDYNCPYSKKAFLTLWQQVLPLYKAEHRVQFSFGLVPQPWHAQTCYVHEAALAVRQLSGDEGFWKASAVLFDHQSDWVDENVLDKTRRQVYEELATCLEKAGTVPSASSVLELLLTAPGNGGNAVGAAVKFACRYHRVRGVHVTPTVHINGIPELNASSSWTKEDWKDRIDSLLTVEQGH
ncbi:hypothetical protein F1559_001269 [Cyanidiococcus yangmingshanensis]|uniref:Thioredoxin-like fold domain-containing protein n=1 Tax=Cyanidiococcus yangmingshanensis TaxID=2690220 RepID=A0A7J7IHT9_9RHOD|nr:hypothetical protein F1559_001269 [Cyanidiococcus yangmingshanensis]